MNQRPYLILSLLTITFSVMLSSCASVYVEEVTETSDDTRDRGTQTAPVGAVPHKIMHEGGIVGTGNEDECKHSENKDKCNDNVK